MMLFCATPAHAAELPPTLQSLLPQDASLTEAGGWTFAALLGWLWRAAQDGGSAPLRFAAQVVFYLAFAALAGWLCTNAGWRRCLDAVAVLGFGAISLAAMGTLVDEVGTAAQESQIYLNTFVPAYSGVLALGGQTAGAAGYSGLFFAMSQFLAFAIERLLLPVMRIYFCFSVSASLWGGGGIEEAAALFGRCLHWLLKGCGALFGSVLGLQSVLTGAADSAAVRMGGSVLAGAIPVVGSAAAAALSGAAAAVRLLKGSLALGLVITLGGAFLPALLRCALYYLAFAGAGILAAGSGQSRCGRICRLFAEGTRLCGSVLTLYFFMVFLSTALMLVTGNGG